MGPKSFQIKAVLFDFDGTLTVPGILDFSAIKKAIECPVNMPILEFIESIVALEARDKASATLEDFELKGAEKAIPNPGAEKAVRYIRSKGLPVGIITRNAMHPVIRALKNFNNLAPSDFDVIISRETPVRPKPSGQGILLAAEKLRVNPKNILMVGDYIFDIQAGNSAGAYTVLLDNQGLTEEIKSEADFIIRHMDELMEILQLVIPFSGGKPPDSILNN